MPYEPTDEVVDPVEFPNIEETYIVTGNDGKLMIGNGFGSNFNAAMEYARQLIERDTTKSVTITGKFVIAKEG